MEKVRLNKKKCQQGLDGMKFELILGLEDKHLYLPPEELKNGAGKTIASLECIGGKVTAYVNAVHCIRPNNVKPFGIADAIKLELVKGRVIDFIEKYLQKHMKDQYSDKAIQNMTVKALEVNITMPCVGGAAPSDVVSLLDLALNKTSVRREWTPGTKYQKINTGCMFAKEKKYKWKIYDKSREQHQKGNLLVAKNLLRIEVVFIGRSLRRMFGNKRSLSDVLSIQAIETMCREYKRVLELDSINEHIKPCLNYCREQLVESLVSAETRHPISEAVIRHKELIPDIEVLRQALKKWNHIRGEEDKSKQAINYYRQKGIGLPAGVLQTIRAFHDAAG